MLHAGAAWADLRRVQRLARAGWLGFEHDPATPIAFATASGTGSARARARRAGRARRSPLVPAHTRRSRPRLLRRSSTALDLLPHRARTSTATCCRSSRSLGALAGRVPRLAAGRRSWRCSCRSLVDRRRARPDAHRHARRAAALDRARRAAGDARRRRPVDAAARGPPASSRARAARARAVRFDPSRDLARLAPRGRRATSLVTGAVADRVLAAAPTATRARRASTRSSSPARAASCSCGPAAGLDGPVGRALPPVAFRPWPVSATGVAPSRSASRSSSPAPSCSGSRSPPAASLAPYFGNSLFVWGALIGVVLAGLSIGYWARRRARRPAAARRGSSSRCSAARRSLVLAIPFVDEPVLELVVALGSRARGSTRSSPRSLLFGLPSVVLAVGLADRRPALGALARAARAHRGDGSSPLSTAGSIAGTFVTAFWLVPELGTDQVLAVGALGAARRRGGRRASRQRLAVG